MRKTLNQWSVGSLLVAFLLATASCGGIRHDGYKSKRTKPWKNAKLIEFDTDYEAESYGIVSHPKRKRSRWYKFKLPGDGRVKVALGLSFFEERIEDPLDIAFEVLDGKFNILATATADDDDFGEPKKERTLAELPRGEYYIHVYTQKKKDEAEFTLTLKYERGKAAYESNFPTNVAYIGTLPVVPVVDDTPFEPKPPKRKPKKRKKKKKVEETPRFRASIIRATTKGKRTDIVIGAGSNRGVASGWRGYLVTSGGSKIANGSFRISKTTASSSYASVGVKRADVLKAGRVVLVGPSK